MFISVADAAEKFYLSKRRVQILCERGRIEGAVRVSGVWLIPKEASKPDDARIKKNTNLLNLSTSKCATENLSMKEVCDILSISMATLKNWIKLDKIKVENANSFDKKYIEDLLFKIKNGIDPRLKSRRNKKNISGKILYKDYIQNANNIKAVENILNTCASLSEKELRFILAYFAQQLYLQSSKDVKVNLDWFYKGEPASSNETFNLLILDLLGKYNYKNFDFSNIETPLKQDIKFIKLEDTLGFIYISLRDLSERKQAGVYYTPVRIVNRLIGALFAEKSFKKETFFDPCCGSGNFLLGLIDKGVSVKRIYGQDIDDISISLARINMFLLDNSLSKRDLDSHFICGDTLKQSFSQKFSVVLGNPPWGSVFSEKDIHFLKKEYRTARLKGIESYGVFIEKGLKSIDKDGYLAYILPESVLSVAAHSQTRKLISENASFKFISFLGNIFSGVQCPAIIVGVKKDSLGNTKGCKVVNNDKEFAISKNRNLNSCLFSFNVDDGEYACIKTIENIANAKYLGNNAKFALGIVTGNNKEFLKKIKGGSEEIILKGSDILRYSIKESGNYIKFTPNSFQQVAPVEIYRAKEKLLYRFISEVPVFAYDNRQTLSLNSCNILIPQIKGLDIKYILAILNSSVAAYYISKKYNSIKLLRSHIESLPIPMMSEEKQNKIIKKVDIIMNSDKNNIALYREIDSDIMDIYSLSVKQRTIIQKFLSDKKTFLS